ncbi:AAA family ATPase [Amycolatopsis sp. NPDC051106]|uniref:AAA family ATPase n=1 Tax=unclassified Amycolatopsis TaxID=2618356 RepID=UPI00343EDA3F
MTLVLLSNSQGHDHEYFPQRALRHVSLRRLTAQAAWHERCKVRFNSFSVSNLRAVKKFEIDDINDFVVVAGQNGSGKSCIFDAIRLLKSVYGGYLANEYHQWFGEFAVSLQDRSSVQKLFRDQSQPIVIEAHISFADSEVAYLRENTEALVQPIAWQEVTGQSIDWWTWSRLAIATQLRYQEPALTKRCAELAEDVRTALENSVHTLSLRIMPNGEMQTSVCKPAEAAFQAYEPEHLGIIEYHSASRTYARQAVGGINLDARAFEDQRRQNRLYNSATKYQNIKTELAQSYLRSLIAEKAGQVTAKQDLNDTLSELFRTFFPDKTYQGARPRPNGDLEFPVRLSSGEEHDIDELSSGEKEILYGYLKLRNSTPRNSVLLIDEPELHLNPSLLQGYTDFYYRHLGLEQNNQLWLVTHSDALLRQAVGNMNYGVYHMIPAGSLEKSSQNQAVEVVADDDVERVAIELVGDLASYQPRGKVVVLEGK